MTTDRAVQGWVADDSTFGARLALIRQRMHWGNVKEAAVACGLPVESWRSWERDGRVPQRLVEIAAIIAGCTGCDYGWLLTGPRLRGEAVGAVKKPYAGLIPSGEIGARHRAAPRAFSPGRRDSSRPASTVRPSTRRPSGGRPADRPRLL